MDQSHPVRVRGLKLPPADKDMQIARSHPVRVRGLKLEGTWVEEHKDSVAPRAGAWVETPGSGFRVPLVPVAPRAGAWVETLSGKSVSQPSRRTPCGCVG